MVTKNLTFEEFLMEKFMEDYTGIADDIEDNFDSYLSDLDGNDYMELGEEYGKWIYDELTAK